MNKFTVNPKAFYDIAYDYKISEDNGQSLLTIEIEDFGALNEKAKNYYEASIEFVEAAKVKKKISRGINANTL